MLPAPLPEPAPLASEDALAPATARAAAYAAHARGEGTLRAYRSAWRAFSTWCAAEGHTPLPATPALLAAYAAALADQGRALATLRVHLAAIQAAHTLAGRPLDLRAPRLRLTLDGIARSLGARPRRQAAAATPDLLRRMLATRPPPETALGARDRALLLLGFGGALRRSELVALRLGDVALADGRGVVLQLRRSKTDQRGEGTSLALWAQPQEPAICPQAALLAWLSFRQGEGSGPAGLSPDAEAPLFVGLSKAGRLRPTVLSDRAVARLVRGAAEAAGIPGAARFSGHSLRAGLATAAGEAGADLAQIMRQTRHRSAEVALGYLRPSEIWRHNVTRRIWEP